MHLMHFQPLKSMDFATQILKHGVTLSASCKLKKKKKHIYACIGHTFSYKVPVQKYIYAQIILLTEMLNKVT